METEANEQICSQMLGGCELVLLPEAALNSDSQQQSLIIAAAGDWPLTSSLRVSRRGFVQSASMVTAGTSDSHSLLPGTLAAAPAQEPLEQFDYGDVALTSDLHEKQLEETHSVLMGLSDDSLLKPFRQMSWSTRPRRWIWAAGITTIPTTSGARRRWFCSQLHFWPMGFGARTHVRHHAGPGNP